MAAHAAGDPASINIISPATDFMSAKDDGTNTTIHLEADVTQGTVDNTVTAVQFAYNDITDGTGAINIGAPVSGPPYVKEWTPPASTQGDNVHIVAQALHGAAPVASDETGDITNDNTRSSVHITNPAPGGSLGEYNNHITVKGTRSSDDPSVSVDATDIFDGTATAVPSNDGNDQHWVATVPDDTGSVPQNGTDNVSTRLHAVAEVNQSDEATRVNVYHAVLDASSLVPRRTRPRKRSPSARGPATSRAPWAASTTTPPLVSTP